MTGKSAADTWVADTWVAGVDGCPGGWLVAFMRVAAGEVRLRIVPQFADVLAAAESAAVIAIDIPIGLPARAGRGGRAPERLVRPLLGKHQSSYFPCPRGRRWRRPTIARRVRWRSQRPIRRARYQSSCS